MAVYCLDDAFDCLLAECNVLCFAGLGAIWQRHARTNVSDFDPELIELMKAVLDDATAMLPEAKRTSAIKAEIASHILACAAKGERDPVALKMAALLYVRR